MAQTMFDRLVAAHEADDAAHKAKNAAQKALDKAKKHADEASLALTDLMCDACDASVPRDDLVRYKAWVAERRASKAKR